MGSHREFTKPQGSHSEFIKPQGCTIGVPPRIHRTPKGNHKTPRVRIHKTPRVHHWGPTANSQNHKGAPLGSHSEFIKPQGCTIGVPPRIHRTPKGNQRVHHWGSTASSRKPKGAPLGYHREFTNPQGCTIGDPPRIHQTTRVHHCGPPRIHKTTRVHHWGPTVNSQNPKGAPLGSHRDFTEPQG